MYSEAKRVAYRQLLKVIQSTEPVKRQKKGVNKKKAKSLLK